MKTETTTYRTERKKVITQPIYVVRFSHVKKFGDPVAYDFSIDVVNAPVPNLTRTQRGFLVGLTGSSQTVIPEQGRSTIGGFSLTLLDKGIKQYPGDTGSPDGGEVLKYFSVPQLSLAQAMTDLSPAPGGLVYLAESPRPLPELGTVEITSLDSEGNPVIERVRYQSKDDVAMTLTVAVNGRGADDTVAAAHAPGDWVENGENIRPGTWCQLYSGYVGMDFADFMLFQRMQVVSRRQAGNVEEPIFQVDVADINRTVRTEVFLAATPDERVSFQDNPITIALQVLLSTGKGTNSGGGSLINYDVLPEENGIGVPITFIDVLGFEEVKAAIPNDVYSFDISSPQDGKSWLETEIYKTVNAYPVVLQDGRLSLRLYGGADFLPRASAPTNTLFIQVVDFAHTEEVMSMNAFILMVADTATSEYVEVQLFPVVMAFVDAAPVQESVTVTALHVTVSVTDAISVVEKVSARAMLLSTSDAVTPGESLALVWA